MIIRRNSREAYGVSDYQLQEEGSNCWLFALCNALTFFGKSPPLKGSPRWEWLMNVGGCRWGNCIYNQAMALQLGLDFHPLSRAEDVMYTVPSILVVKNHTHGWGNHICLVIDGDPNTRRVTLVNYRWGGGPVVETLNWEDFSKPPPIRADDACAFSIHLTSIPAPEITVCPFCSSSWYAHEKNMGFRTEPWHYSKCPRDNTPRS